MADAADTAAPGSTWAWTGTPSSLAACGRRREEAQAVNSLDGAARWADKGVHQGQRELTAQETIK